MEWAPYKEEVKINHILFSGEQIRAVTDFTLKHQQRILQNARINSIWSLAGTRRNSGWVQFVLTFMDKELYSS